jgi:hypothetical protein
MVVIIRLIMVLTWKSCFPDFLVAQMKTQAVSAIWDPKWKVYFYKKQGLKSPTNNYDCFVKCFYMELLACHFYTFKDQVCYLGNFTQLTGSVLDNVNLTMNLVSFRNCKYS